MERTFSLRKEKSGNVIGIDKVVKKDQEVWILARSDCHWDNPKCRRDIEKRHLDMAVERDAIILDFGDLFCAMEGKGDKRASKSIREEHSKSAYYSSLINTATEYYMPYARQMALLGQGNHESSVVSHAGIDLTSDLASRLTDKTGFYVHAGGYVNWVVLTLKTDKPNSNRQASFTIFSTHGYGGGGPVTMDVIQSQRQAAYIEGADAVFSGHTHDAFMVERMKVKVSLHSREEIVNRMLFFKIPTYKDEWTGNKGRGFHVEKGRGPKPLGAWWLKLKLKSTDSRDTIDVGFERAT